MKKSMTLALGITAALGFGSVHAIDLSLYCVHDDGLNDSQFCYGTPLVIAPPPPGSTVPPTVIPDGPIHHDCDIEALDVRFDPNGTIYAASGDDTPRPGHLYRVVPLGGVLYDLGPVYVGNTRMMEIDAISVLPSTGEIWGWSQGQGLFVIDPDQIPFPGKPNQIPLPGSDVGDCTNLPPDGQMAMDDPDLDLSPIVAQEEIPVSDPIEIEDIEWNFGGTILYAVENDHCGHNVDSHGANETGWPYTSSTDRDYDCGINLWAYFKDQEHEHAPAPAHVELVCTNLLPQITAILGDGAEIEGLESLPRTFLGTPTTQDTLVFTFHGPSVLRYAVITKPTFPLGAPCTLVATDQVTTSEELNDIEGVGLSPELSPVPPIVIPSPIAISNGMSIGEEPVEQMDAEAAADWAALIQEAIEETPNEWQETLPEELQP